MSAQLADRFERGLVLRVGRAVPLSLAVFACLVLGIAVLVLLYTAIPTRGVQEPAAAVVPAEVVVSVADIRAALTPAPAAVENPRDAQTAPADQGPSAGARAVATALHQIRALVPEELAPWRDAYQRVCRQYYFGTCYGEYQQLVARGISSYLTAVTDLDDVEHSRAEAVEIADDGVRYVVNGSNSDRKVATLNEARAILQGQAPAIRAQYLRAWSELRVQREAARQHAIRMEQERIVRQRAEEASRVLAEQLSKSATRSTAAAAAASAIGLLWTIALALAVLAIERNTRALRNADISRSREAGIQLV